MATFWNVSVSTVADPQGRKNSDGETYYVYKAVATTTSTIVIGSGTPANWSVTNNNKQSTVQQMVSYADTWLDMQTNLSRLMPANDNPVPANIGG